MKERLRSARFSARLEEDKVILSRGKNGDGAVDGGDYRNKENGFELNGEERPVLISSDPDLVEELVGPSPRVGIEGNGNELDHGECGEGEDADMGKRGRKRSSRDGTGCDGVVMNKVKEEPFDGKVQVVGRVLRSRSAAMSGGQKEKSGDETEFDVGWSSGAAVRKRNRGSDQLGKKRVKVEKDDNNGLVSVVRKKLKRKRGRPAKIEGKNGASKGMVDKEEKVAGLKLNESKRGSMFASNVKGEPSNDLYSEKRLIGKELNSKRFSSVVKNKPADLETEDNVTPSGLRPKRVNAFNTEKKRRNEGGKSKGEKVKVGSGRATEKKQLREQIMHMLLNSGWTIEYRPRMSKEYNDAVYVSPEGRAYWSITLAYSMLKRQFEDGDGNSRHGKTGSSFTPLPEEVLNKLTRVTKKKMEKEMELKLKGEGESNLDEVGIEKKPAKKHGAKDVGSVKHKEKQNSLIRSGAKSSKGRMKGKSLLHEEDNSTGTSHRGMPMSVRGRKSRQTQSRKRCALLVRSSKEVVSLNTDGYIPYSGKRTVLTWMIDLGTMPLNGKVQYMNRRKTRVILEGRITRDGIHCDCCSEVFPISKFETHAGSSRMCQPFQNIFLETGASFLQCQLDSWNKQEDSERKGFHLIDVDGDDPNDDTCGMCGDGGDLICCDSCPSTFHQSCLDIQKFPSGDWHCVHCSCKFCGMVSWNSSQRDDNHDINVTALLMCCLCEEKYHQSCIQAKNAINDDSSSPSFCGKKCEEVFERLQRLLGVKHELEDGFSWTFVRRHDVGSDLSIDGMPQKVECNSKLAVALAVMDECFLPIVDHRSGINLIHNVLYNCGSNFNRLNYSGFYTAILERGDEIISAASIRIHGHQLAEMPFIGTRHIYRRQGMCSRLLSAIETALCSLNVEKLVIPAISELMQTWTSVFGFKPLEVSKKREMRNMSMLVFPGTDMLQKPLLKHQFSDESIKPAVNGVSNDSDVVYSAGPDINISGEGIASHAYGVDNEPVAIESGSQLPDGSLNDTSDITSETVNFPESAADTKCLVQLDVTHDNLQEGNKTIINSQGYAYDPHEQNGQYISEDINEYQNAVCASVVPASDEKTVKWDSKLNQHSSCEAESKSFLDSRPVSVATSCEGQILQASMEGKETVASEVKRGGIVSSSLISHAGIVTGHQNVAFVHGSQVSGENIVCHNTEALSHMSHDAMGSKHHDSQLVQVSGCTLDVEDRMLGGEMTNDVAVAEHGSQILHKTCNYSSVGVIHSTSVSDDYCAALPIDCNFNSSSHEIEVYTASVDTNSHPLCGASVAAAEPSFQSSRTHCKSTKLTPCFDKSDFPGVDTCVLSSPAQVNQHTALEVTMDNIHDPKEASTASQTNLHSLVKDPSRPHVVSKSSKQLESDSPVDHTSVTQCNSESLCNSNSGSGVSLLCAPGGCNACGTPEVIVLSNQAS